jgi:hypothetical protein
MGRNVEEVVRKLTEKASLFVDYTRSMGLSKNASKTQLLFSANAGNVADVTVEVDRSTIKPSNNIELLGVGYDRKLSTTPHLRLLLAAVRQRASIVARLANQLPRGMYLQQLSYRLVMGKFAHALAAVARSRLDSEDTASVIWRIGPPGAAGLSAQRGHVPFGLKEGRARCTTSRRFGSEEEKTTSNEKKQVQQQSATACA